MRLQLSITRPLSCALVAVYLSLAPLVAQPVARMHPADTAAPLAVAYHLTVLYLQGPTAGHTLDAYVVGTLDSAGALTATLTATSGATATVIGSASNDGVHLVAQGTDMTLQLTGQGTGTGGYGGMVGETTAPVGSWLLTPEGTALTLTFRASITGGRDRGQTYAGTLVIASGAEGRIDGALTLDTGAIIAVSGHLVNGNLQVLLYLPDRGLLMGLAPQGTVTSTGTQYTVYRGMFIGPTAGDRGAWAAIQTVS